MSIVVVWVDYGFARTLWQAVTGQSNAPGINRSCGPEREQREFPARVLQQRVHHHLDDENLA
jgi:hypothetical protein